MKQDYGTVETAIFDYGAKIGIAVVRNGERRAVRVAHPFAEDIDREPAKQ